MPEKKDQYTRISQNVDLLISKHGSEKTAEIIEQIVLSKDASTISTVEIQKAILFEVTRHFKISIKLLETSQSELSKKARKSCFYLLKHHGKLSLSQIRIKFPKLQRTTGYISNYITQMEAIVQMPNVDKDHFSIHQKIESQLEKHYV